MEAPAAGPSLLAASRCASTWHAAAAAADTQPHPPDRKWQRAADADAQPHTYLTGNGSALRLPLPTPSRTPT